LKYLKIDLSRNSKSTHNGSIWAAHLKPIFSTRAAHMGPILSTWAAQVGPCDPIWSIRAAQVSDFDKIKIQGSIAANAIKRL
jgi:hypothetical protein